MLEAQAPSADIETIDMEIHQSDDQTDRPAPLHSDDHVRVYCFGVADPQHDDTLGKHRKKPSRLR
jgi:hypothetical protein